MSISIQEEVSQSPAYVTKRHRFRGKGKPSLYLDVTTGRGVSNTGEHFQCSAGLGARELIDALPQDIEVVYLTGELPQAPQVKTEDALLYSPFNSWIIGAVPETMDPDSGESHDSTRATIRRNTGREVDLRVISCWTGTHALTPDQVYEAMSLVREELRKMPNWEDADLLITPSITGAELWHCMIGFDQKQGHGVEYPILSEDLRDLIHRTSGQGRFEMLSCPDSSGKATNLYYLDDRLAYAARALAELGIGPATHDYESKYEGYRPARYLVRFHIPEDWHHVGLLMVKRPGVSASSPASEERWYFPNQPGYVGETWADASELRIAFAPFPHQCPTCRELYSKNDGRRCPQHGWHIEILERIIFTKGQPLKAWAEKLIQVRESVSPIPAAQAIVRNLILHTIGRFHGTHRPVTRMTQDRRQVPNNTPVKWLLSSDGYKVYQWQEEGTVQRHKDYDRPEWSSQVWAKERARLLLNRYGDGTFTGALTLPYESIVAFRLDAMYTTVNPGWSDNGRPGQMRLKGHLPGPVAWPKEETDLANIKRNLS